MVVNLTVDGISVDYVSCFDHLDIKFNEKYNLICGTNGIGKTSILNIIGASFVSAHYYEDVRKNAKAGKDTDAGWQITVSNNGVKRQQYGRITNFLPEERGNPFGISDFSEQIIYLSTVRDFKYSRLNSIDRDPKINAGQQQAEILKGINPNQIKSWFANRYLMHPHGAKWPVERHHNLELAKRCFSILDPSVSLDEVETSSFDIYVNTQYGRIPFEYLSSGFRASLSVMLGIIKEIEFRKLGCSAAEFSGIILIDELDLHLHPSWQRILPRALREAFPNAQFIVTSHSPHMIQDADANEVIALVTSESGHPRIAPLKPSKYGFKGWSIEEILSDVMGLSEVTTPIYNSTLAEFYSALEREDQGKVSSSLRELAEMLNPKNELLKVLSIQAAAIGVLND